GTVNDSQYVWLPLTFPTNTTMNLPWFPKISVNTSTGAIGGVGGGPYYKFASKTDGMCVEIADSSASNGAKGARGQCASGTDQLNQTWRLQGAGDGYVRILAQHSGKCLDVSDNSTADGGAVIQWPCGTGTNQQWQFRDEGDGYYSFVARHSGKCLEVTDGGSLVQNTCDSGAAQLYLVRGVK
ncbi:RICIN domain-containing protein, partial [Streptomyces sp. AS02]|uniref:RICIN domain-containing protein n=1 Tax=Streptomyces sp. AS02 TaxID=2938946 RepID=UPI0020211F41